MAIKFTVREIKPQLSNLKGKTLYLPAKAAEIPRAELREVAELVSQRSTASRADVLAVLDSLGWVMGLLVQSGRGINLPGMGSFQIHLRSKASEKRSEATAARIRSARLSFTPCTELKEHLRNVQYAQAAAGASGGSSDDPSGGGQPTPPGGGTNLD